MTMQPRPSTLQAGQRLGPYEILAPIGAGGMGEVYRARDPRLGREVAVKVLPGEIAGDPERLRRFEQEARAAGSISHPNILTVFDVGSDRCGPYIVFELLEGSTLRAVLAGGALPLERAVDVAAQVARGLAAAHAKGIVHRDLKPENLFVNADGLVKILDFGLAKLVAHEALLAANPDLPTLTHATEAGAMLGTVGYMSPEQVRGERVDARTDVFSFGAILFEMLAGRRAFAGDSAAEVLSAILRDEPPALGGPGSSVPPALDGLVRRCLAKDAAARPQSAQELAAHLRPVMEALAPAASFPAGAPAARRVMLVVLPFENLSRDPEQEYFSDGLTEETIADLGGLGSDQLGVIARTSAMRFKGSRKSVAEIGRELGVEFALEGSVRRQDERVRISVRLVRAADQTHVWAQQYDRELRDLLAVQDELGRAIAEKVQVRLAGAAGAPPRERRLLDQTAYDLYLRGLFHLWRVTRPELERAIDCFRRAVDSDPRLAVAYAGLAQAHAILPIAGGARPSDAFPAAERAATQALGIDPECAEALTAMTILRHWRHWDWAGAETHARRAIARNPSSARAHQVFGRLLTNVGRHDEAIAEIDVARQLDPLAPLILALSADFRFEAHREDEAEAYVRRAHEIDPDFWVARVSSARLHMHRGRYREALAAAEAAQRSSGGHSEPLALAGCCLGALGRRDEARAILAELESRRAAGYVPASHLATIQVGLGDAGEALRWLERAFEDRDVWLTELAVEPRWDPLRDEPRFRELLRRMDLPAPSRSPATTPGPVAEPTSRTAPSPVPEPRGAGRRLRRTGAIAAIGAVVALAAVGALVRSRARESRERWAREDADGEIARAVADNRIVEAYEVAQRALAIAPDDARLKQAWANVAAHAPITSEPPGAEVEFRRYLGNDGRWISVGRTPITDASIPFGLLRWRVSKPGYETLEVAQGVDVLQFRLAASGSSRPGMVLVPRGSFRLDSTREEVQLPDYWLDRYEVTNREFKAFVDAGGYRRREFWTEPFVKEGRTLSWEEAMAEFRDPTGRPGPATWELGAYPQGEDDFPVGGVSWYEAAAYAAFAGKRLPTVYHWFRAAGAFGIFSDILAASNFSGKGPVKVGSSGGLGPYGTYDMAGNVKEWCWNLAGGGRRYLLGGGWNEPTYTFRDEDARLPFERAPSFGFRCMAQQDALPPHLTDPIRTLERDTSVFKPVDDRLLGAFLRLYDYDPTPLDARLESADDANPAWREERASVRAAYGDERLPICLFLPKNSTPPYQPVVLFPGSNAVHQSSSRTLDLLFADFLVRSGRALVYPIYKGTYERRLAGPGGPNVRRDVTVERGKDLRRTVDYLATRSDMDVSRLAFEGISLGASLGPIFLAIEPRFRAAVLLSGGFDPWNVLPEANPVNFAPRVRVPVLMVNGREDFEEPYETSQLPMFRALGTPAADKRHVVFEGGHIPPRPQEVFRAVLDWLDERLGPVR